MSVEIIKVPDTGSSDPVDVIEVSVKAGDQIAPEDTIVVLESDKATVEVPAPLGGKVLKLLVNTGDRVKEGDPLLEVETADDAGAEEKPAATKAEEKPAPAAPEQKKAAAPAKAVLQTVKVPDLGDIKDAELIELNVKAGDRIDAEQILGVLESDKASLEIPAPAAGVVKSVSVKVGDKLNTGDALLELEGTGDAEPEQAPASTPEETPKARASEKPAAPAKAPDTARPAGSDSGPSGPVHAGPAVRKLARELGVDLARVRGTGPKNRILKDDVHAHVKALLSERPAVSGGGGFSIELPDIDFSKFGEVERVELNKLRRVSASNLHRAWVTIPHVTQFDDADITTLEAFRQSENQRLQKSGAKLTMLAFLVKACAVALREFPHFNSSLENGGEALIQKHYINIGVAVDTPNGLVVPVVRDADKKGVVEIAREVGELAEKARNRKLAPGDMQGGTFSISSLGGIGGTAFTPIVNWPEVAILGVSRTQKKPVWNGKEFEPRDMLPLSLSYDHRVIDGADAARFITYLSGVLADMRRALL